MYGLDGVGARLFNNKCRFDEVETCLSHGEGKVTGRKKENGTGWNVETQLAKQTLDFYKLD